MSRAVEGHQPEGSRELVDVMGQDTSEAWSRERTSFDGPFRDFCTRVAFGEVWQREGLNRRSRRIATIATLVALGQLKPLRSHVRAALADDMSQEELAELLLHTSVYCGIPAALQAFEVAAEEVEATQA